MNKLDSDDRYTMDLIGLLQEIVQMFDDAYSRPESEIALYEHYQKLQKTHQVKLVGRFIVISGGRQEELRVRKRPRSTYVTGATLSTPARIYEVTSARSDESRKTLGQAKE